MARLDTERQNKIMNTKAMVFAIMAHENVNHRYNGSPYSVHLMHVVMNALKFIDAIPNIDGLRDDVINACWLHDTIEDCRVSYNDLKKLFGDTVADLVYAVTNNKGKTRKQRANNDYYKGIINIAYGRFVKLCDRIANVEYSQESKSSMLTVYQQENEHFILSLFPNEIPLSYQPLVVYLNKAIELDFSYQPAS